MGDVQVAAFVSTTLRSTFRRCRRDHSRVGAAGSLGIRPVTNLIDTPTSSRCRGVLAGIVGIVSLNVGVLIVVAC
jgi:hypothetical protein